ncbi:MAG: isocitrate lyase/phosphoenolpyruvate mutase family protein [Pseudomonadota bacterium]
MSDITKRAQAFADLHQSGIFVMPNCWDVGSALMLAGLGAKAIATASAGLAGTMGLGDGAVGRDAALSHAKAVVEAVDIPVSADLENCYADDPDGVAETVRLAAETGLSGCSVEDKKHGTGEFYERAHSIERVAAAVEAVRAFGRPFVLTARADGFLGKGYDLDEAMARAHAFADLGAGCIFVPGIPENEALTTLCADLSKPVSYLTGMGEFGSVEDLRGLGVRRVSTGPFLYRAAMGHALGAARSLIQTGDTDGLVQPLWGDTNHAMKAGKSSS